MKNLLLFVCMTVFLLSANIPSISAQTTPTIVVDKLHTVDLSQVSHYYQNDLEYAPDGSFILEGGSYRGQVPNMALNSFVHSLDIIAFDPISLISPNGLQVDASPNPSSGLVYNYIDNVEVYQDTQGNTHTFYTGMTNRNILNVNVFDPLLPSATPNVSVNATYIPGGGGPFGGGSSGQWIPATFVAKASINGGFQWVIQTNRVGITDITIDNNGNSYILGNVPNGSGMTFGGQNVARLGGGNYWVAAVDPQGQILWVYIGGPAIAKKIKFLSVGILTIAGNVQPEPIGINQNFPGALLPPTQYFGGQDTFIFIMDVYGQPYWAYIIGGEGNDNITHLAAKDNPTGDFYFSLRVGEVLSSPNGFNSISLNDASTGPYTSMIWATLLGNVSEMIIKFSNFSFAAINPVDFPAPPSPIGPNDINVNIQAMDVTRCGDLVAGMSFHGQNINLFGLGNFSTSAASNTDYDLLIGKLSSNYLTPISAIQLGTPNTEHIIDVTANPVADQFVFMGPSFINGTSGGTFATVSLIDNDPVNNTCP